MTDIEFMDQVNVYLGKIAELGKKAEKDIIIGAVLLGKNNADNLIALKATDDLSLHQGTFALALMSTKMIYDASNGNKQKQPWEK